MLDAQSFGDDELALCAPRVVTANPIKDVRVRTSGCYPWPIAAKRASPTDLEDTRTPSSSSSEPCKENPDLEEARALLDQREGSSDTFANLKRLGSTRIASSINCDHSHGAF